MLNMEPDLPMLTNFAVNYVSPMHAHVPRGGRMAPLCAHSARVKTSTRVTKIDCEMGSHVMGSGSRFQVDKCFMEYVCFQPLWTLVLSIVLLNLDYTVIKATKHEYPMIF